MSETTKVKIQFKKGFPEPITVEGEKEKPIKVQPKSMTFSSGNKSITVQIGKTTEVELAELQVWLDTGKLEVAQESAPTSADNQNQNNQEEGGNQ